MGVEKAAFPGGVALTLEMVLGVSVNPRDTQPRRRAGPQVCLFMIEHIEGAPWILLTMWVKGQMGVSRIFAR